MSKDREKIKELFGESTGERFLNYADAHEGGDIRAAIESLLFCHKVLFAKILSEAKQNDNARDQDGNKH